MPESIVGMHPDDCFPSSYSEGRVRFLKLCEQFDARLHAYDNPNEGAEGEDLSCDVAWYGPDDAEYVMVLVSATHGVEGFSGSAAQTDWLLTGGAAHLPVNVGMLLVHALNPHGFSWHRRVTEDNVDLNRNGIDFDAAPPENPGYEDLRDAFSPKSIDDKALAIAKQELDSYCSEHGYWALQNARLNGQYSDPKGIHFGGFEPTWSRRTIERIVADYHLPGRKQVAVVDCHTGLGPFGYGEPICGCRPEQPGRDLARLWYGVSMTEPLLGTSSSTVIPGLNQYIWAREVGAERLAFIALEFGTYPAEFVDSAVVAENWLYSYGDPNSNSPEARRIKSNLLKAFYPATQDWQEMILFRSRQIIRQTLTGLAEMG